MGVARTSRYAALYLGVAYAACGGIAEKDGAGEDDTGFGGASSSPAAMGFTSISTTSSTLGGASTAGGLVVTSIAGTIGGFGAGGGPAGAGGAGFGMATTGGVRTSGYAGQAGAPSVNELCDGQCSAMSTAADQLDCVSPSFAQCFTECEVMADLVADYGCIDEFVAWSGCIANLGVDGFACYEGYGVSPEGCTEETYDMVYCILGEDF